MNEIEKDNIKELSDSYETVGAIHAIIYDQDTGKIISGKNRSLTGKPWKKEIVKFHNNYERSLFKAAENLVRKTVNDEERTNLITNVQDDYFKLNNEYLTQEELTHRLSKSRSWVSPYWDSKWTHTIKGSTTKADEVQTIVSGSDTIKEDVIDNTKALLKLRREDNANVFNDDYKKTINSVPKEVRDAFHMNQTDDQVLKEASKTIDKSVDNEPVDVVIRRKRVIKLFRDEFVGDEDKFWPLATSLYSDFVDALVKCLPNEKERV